MNCQDFAELLPLYLSGELNGARAAEFTGHMRACAACAREMEQQTELDSRLRASVVAEEIDSAALDQRIRQNLTAKPAGFRPAIAAAAIAAAVLLGGLGYRAWSTTPIPRMCTDAAQDHQREVIDGQPRTWLTDPAAIEALAARPGVPASAVAALAQSGYRIERGKLCRLDGHLFLHLVYTGGGGQEFSAFLRQREPQTVAGRAVATVQIGREHAGFFETQRLTAVIVTNQPGDAAGDLARFAASVL